jgi:hypothetical protein
VGPANLPDRAATNGAADEDRLVDLDVQEESAVLLQFRSMKKVGVTCNVRCLQDSALIQQTEMTAQTLYLLR